MKRKNLKGIVGSIAALLIFGLVSTAFGMPLSPDSVERLKEQRKMSATKTRRAQWPEGINNRAACIKALEKSGIKLSPQLAATEAVIGERKVLVLLVDFSDNIATTYPQSHYEEMLFSTGTYSTTGSMRDYYLENSWGALDVTGVVNDWYRAPQPYSYYVDSQNGFGVYPKNVQKLVEDVVLRADANIDFSQYDSDGDGFVDALFVVFAGGGAEADGGNVNKIWSHMWATDSPISVDGVKVYLYAMAPEDGKIGVFGHELGHVFGLPDLYDYGYDSAGVGMWSMMAGGSWGGALGEKGSKPTHFDAWSKVELGWITPTNLSLNQTISIKQVTENEDIYKVWTDGKSSTEYFLIENRQQTGFDISIPGSGLLIWHIDETVYNNNNQLHYKVALEQADGSYHLENNTNRGDAGDPWPGTSDNTVFSFTSTPDSKSYARADTYVAVKNISSSAETMTADIYIRAKGTDFYSISGYVKDSSGNGVTGVKISLTGDSYITGSDGFYQFYLASGAYTLTPEKSGWTFVPTDIRAINLSSNLTNQNFTATPTFTYDIKGSILGGAGGATVFLSGDTTSHYYTTTVGIYEFLNLPPGYYEVTPSFSGWVFTPEKYIYTSLASNQDNQDFTGTINQGTLAGTVKDGAGNPVSNAWIDAWDWNVEGGGSATININGDYEIKGLVSGSYDVSVTPPADSGLVRKSETGVSIIAGQTTTLDFTLGIEGKISGRITDSAGNPVSNVWLYASDWEVGGWGSDYTDTNGYYEIKGLVSGSYDVYVYPPSDSNLISKTERNISVTQGQTTTLNFTLTIGGKISGRITDGAGNPVSNAWLYASDWQVGGWGSANTDTNGYYEIRGLPTGSYYLTVDPPLGSDLVRKSVDSVSVTKEQTTTYNFTLEVGGKISGLITDEFGNPVSNAWIYASDWQVDGWGSAYTDSSGTYKISGLPAGSYYLSVDPSNSSDPNLIQKWIDNVSVSLGQTITQNFVLPVGGKIIGKVTDIAGNPVSGASLWASAAGGWGYAETDASGNYEIKGLETGSYWVSVSPPQDSDLAGKWNEGVSVTLGQTTTLNFSLPVGGKISGKVVDYLGNPVRDAWVDGWGYDEQGVSKTLIRKKLMIHMRSAYKNLIPAQKAKSLSPSSMKISKSNILPANLGPKKSYWDYSHTDSNGNYTLRGLEAGNYTVSVDSPYNSDLTGARAKGISVVMAQTTIQDFTLSLGGKIIGKVTDIDGNPVANAWLSAYTSGWGSYGWGETDHNGEYVMRGLAAGEYTVRVDPPWKSELAEEEVSGVKVTAGGEIVQNFVLKIGGRITGKVTDKKGNPVSGAGVDVWGGGWGYDTTSSLGIYTVRGLPTGTYTMRVYPEDSDLAMKRITGISITAGDETVQDVVLELGGKITGKVTDKEGNPVKGVWVDAYGLGYNWGYDETDSEGKYTLRGLPPDTYTVEAYPPWETDFARQRISGISVVSEQEVTIDFTLPFAGKITGKVAMQDLPTSSNYYYEVVAFQSDVVFSPDNIWNNVMESAGWAWINDKGDYTMERMWPGTFDIYPYLWYESGTFYSPQKAPSLPDTGFKKMLREKFLKRKSITPQLVQKSQSGDFEWWLTMLGSVSDVEVKEGKETPVREITPAIGTGWLNGTVSIDKGKSIYAEEFGSLIVLLTPDGKLKGLTMIMPSGSDISSGKYKIGNLKAGKYTAVAIVKEYAVAAMVVEIGVGGTTLDFVLSKGAIVNGKVSDKDGKAIEGASVVISGTNFDKSAVTDSQGNYSFAGLAAGSYIISATAGGYEKAEKDITVEKDKSHTVNFSLGLGGSISGTLKVKGKAYQGGYIYAVSSTGELFAYVVSDAAGAYKISNLALGDYLVGAFVPGYEIEVSTVKLTISNPTLVVDFDLLSKKVNFTFGIYRISTPRGVVIQVKTDFKLNGLEYEFKRENGDTEQAGTQTTATNKYSFSLMNETIPSDEVITLNVYEIQDSSNPAPGRPKDTFAFSFDTLTGVDGAVNELTGGTIEMASSGETEIDRTKIEIFPGALTADGKEVPRMTLVKRSAPWGIEAKKTVSFVYELGVKDASVKEKGKIKISLYYTADKVNDSEYLRVYYYNASKGEWEEVPGSSVDSLNQIVSVTLTGSQLVSVQNKSLAQGKITSLASAQQIGKYVVLQGLSGELYTGANLKTYVFPNPFNPEIQVATIKTCLPGTGDAKVEVKIYDITGQLVYTIPGKTLARGQKHEIIWEGINNNNEKVASGIYIYILKADSDRDIKKIAVIK